MTRKIYRILSGLLLTLVGAATFVSCSDDNGVATLSGPVPVYLHVSADYLGDLNATRATNDPYASDGEFMNTLCVFVVNSSNVIEAKFGPDILESYSDASTGDLTDWTSDKIELTTGAKTIYAFSNWNNMGSDAWEAIIALEEGASLTADDLNFVVDDPAGKVDIENGKYIPMSGKAEATIGADINYNQLIEVGMDRLVGKVTIAVNGDAEADVVLGNFTFTGWADKVPLMGDDNSTYTYSYENGYSATLNQSISANASGVQIASFYVNETYRPSSGGTGYDGFEMTMQTDRYGGTYYEATTERTEIPRNCIYPIVLTLDRNVLDLGVRAWTDPLGIEEVQYYNIEMDGDKLIVYLLDVTSTFQFNPSMLYNGTAVQTATWKWTYYNTDDGSVCTIDETTGVVTVTSLTATPGYEYGFSLTVDWTSESTSGVTTTHSRTYTIDVDFVEGWPSFTQVSRAWWSQSYGSETVRMKVR